MDIICEADSSAPPTTQEDSPSSCVHEDLSEGDGTNVHEDLLEEDGANVHEDISEEDGETVREDCVENMENPSFPPITLETFENHFKQLINGQVDENVHKRNYMFTGYTDQEKDFFFQYTDKKSEIIYDYFQKAKYKYKESMLKSANGRIPVPVLSKSMNAFLISPKFLLKPVPKTPKNVNPAGQRDLEKMEANQKKPIPEVTSDFIGNLDSSLTLTHLTASPSASSIPVRGPRLIQTPKRYLDGEEERPKTVKRAPRRKAVDKESLFEMGLLHPKYPRKAIGSLWGENIDTDICIQKNPQQNCTKVSGGANSMFAISSMLHSGELQYIINLYLLEMEHKQKLEQLESQLENIPRIEKPTPQEIEFTNETRLWTPNPSPHTLAMKRPAPSSTNSLTIVPLKLLKKLPAPPPALVPIQRSSSPECLTITKHSGPVVTAIKVKPTALQTSFKAAGNMTTTTPANVGSISRTPMHPPKYSKILPKMANPGGVVGPFPQPPVLTGKTFKRNTMQPKSPQQQTIRPDNGSSAQTHKLIPDFMMNFLGSNYGLSSLSESERMLMPPPPRSFIWHPELIDNRADEESLQRMMSFLTKCPV